MSTYRSEYPDGTECSTVCVGQWTIFGFSNIQLDSSQKSKASNLLVDRRLIMIEFREFPMVY